MAEDNDRVSGQGANMTISSFRSMVLTMLNAFHENDGDPCLLLDSEGEFSLGSSWRLHDEPWMVGLTHLGSPEVILSASNEEIRVILQLAKKLREAARRRRQHEYVERLLAKVVRATDGADGTKMVAISRYGEVRLTANSGWRSQPWVKSNRDWLALPAYGFVDRANFRLLKDALVARAKELDEPKALWLGESLPSESNAIAA